MTMLFRVIKDCGESTSSSCSRLNEFQFENNYKTWRASGGSDMVAWFRHTTSDGKLNYRMESVNNDWQVEAEPTWHGASWAFQWIFHLRRKSSPLIYEARLGATVFWFPTWIALNSANEPLPFFLPSRRSWCCSPIIRRSLDVEAEELNDSARPAYSDVTNIESLFYYLYGIVTNTRSAVVTWIFIRFFARARRKRYRIKRKTYQVAN